MAAWRRIALAHFPELRPEIQDRRYTIYGLFADLLTMVREDHDADNTARLRHIYAFAAWCSTQRNKDIWNAAGVSFYEHLFDRRTDWQRVLPWVSEEVIRNCWGLWEWRLTKDELDTLRKMIAKRRRERQA